VREELQKDAASVGVGEPVQVKCELLWLPRRGEVSEGCVMDEVRNEVVDETVNEVVNEIANEVVDETAADD
jgi:hypothetical protein